MFEPYRQPPRIVEARPLAVRFDEAPWHCGLTRAELTALHEAGKLPILELGASRLVMLRDLDALLGRLSRPDEPEPRKAARAGRRRAGRGTPPTSEEPVPTAA